MFLNSLDEHTSQTWLFTEPFINRDNIHEAELKLWRHSRQRFYTDEPEIVGEENKNLVLAGLMGSGKTTVGRLVAFGLDRQFIDTDQYLEENYGSAQQILQRPYGDEEFASIEQSIALDLAHQQRLVIATGGRFCLNAESVAALSKSSIFLCLTAPLEELVARLSNPQQSTYRPRFVAAKNKLKLMQQLEKISEPHFKSFEKIVTNQNTAEEVAEQLIQRFS